MPSLTLNQETIFYTLQRQPQARHNIILIHGAGGNHLVWPAALRRLPEANVYALDLPGHGKSSGEGHDSINDYATFIAQFINHLALDNVVLIGHSMGGAIVQTLGVTKLPEVSALVLIGTGAKLSVSPTILEQIMPDFEQAVTIINSFAWTANTPPMMVARGQDLLAETAPAVLYQDFSACNQFDIRTQLAHISAPTLVIAGSADKLTPARNGRFLANHIPQAQFTLLEGAGHMMMVEKPGETATVIREFLTNC